MREALHAAKVFALRLQVEEGRLPHDLISPVDRPGYERLERVPVVYGLELATLACVKLRDLPVRTVSTSSGHLRRRRAPRFEAHFAHQARTCREDSAAKIGSCARYITYEFAPNQPMTPGARRFTNAA
jgi:hypothetical protein